MNKQEIDNIIKESIQNCDLNVPDIDHVLIRDLYKVIDDLAQRVYDCAIEYKTLTEQMSPGLPRIYLEYLDKQPTDGVKQKAVNVIQELHNLYKAGISKNDDQIAPTGKAMLNDQDYINYNLPHLKGTTVIYGEEFPFHIHLC